ncbi:hypothetical protein [Ruminococcus difficilis]|uniref:Uncharacterized protein n=1 Tax=Ruminococcus difficilis TaxID=2763069 RepID=A0A934WUB8_9FIRM|nr:hypothetical protein [Ruminococcus difficilis]MBK6090112.1 hypothetical protein [Ruminococcus difficilis]
MTSAKKHYPIGFIIGILLNCLCPLAAAVMIQKTGADLLRIILIFFLTHTVLVLINIFAAQNTFQYIILSVHLGIATVIAHFTWILLCFAYNNEINEVFAFLPYAIIVSLVCVTAFASGGVGLFFLRTHQTKDDPSRYPAASKTDRIITIVTMLLWVIFLIAVCIPYPVHVSDQDHATITYYVNDYDVVEKELTKEEASELSALLNRQVSVIMPYFWFFGDTRSIRFGSKVFQVDSEGNSIRYHARYIHLSEQDKTKLNAIFNRYETKS